MKKPYIKPAIRKEQLLLENMLAASPETPVDAELRVRFDEDELFPDLKDYGEYASPEEGRAKGNTTLEW